MCYRYPTRQKTPRPHMSPLAFLLWHVIFIQSTAVTVSRRATNTHTLTHTLLLLLYLSLFPGGGVNHGNEWISFTDVHKLTLLSGYDCFK